MACPHVSGVAALGLSYAVQQGRHYNSREFREMVINSARPVDDVYASGFKYLCKNWSIGNTGNVDKIALSNYAGKMGKGVIDARRLLDMIDGTIKDIDGDGSDDNYGNDLPEGLFQYVIFNTRDNEFEFIQNLNSQTSTSITGTYVLEYDEYEGNILSGRYDHASGLWLNDYVISGLTPESMVWTVLGDPESYYVYRTCRSSLQQEHSFPYLVRGFPAPEIFQDCEAEVIGEAWTPAGYDTAVGHGILFPVLGAFLHEGSLEAVVAGHLLARYPVEEAQDNARGGAYRGDRTSFVIMPLHQLHQFLLRSKVGGARYASREDHHIVLVRIREIGRGLELPVCHVRDDSRIMGACHIFVVMD